MTSLSFTRYQKLYDLLISTLFPTNDFSFWKDTSLSYNKLRTFCSSEIGTTEIGTTEIGTREIGTREIGTREIGTTEIGTREIGTTEIGTIEIGTREIGTSHDTEMTKNEFEAIRKAVSILEFKEAQDGGCFDEVSRLLHSGFCWSVGHGQRQARIPVGGQTVGGQTVGVGVRVQVREGCKMSNILELIQAERDRIRAKRGVQDLEPERYLSILVEEIGEAAQAINDWREEKGYIRDAMEEMVQVCAVAIDMYERLRDWNVAT